MHAVQAHCCEQLTRDIIMVYDYTGTRLNTATDIMTWELCRLQHCAL